MRLLKSWRLVLLALVFGMAVILRANASKSYVSRTWYIAIRFT